MKALITAGGRATRLRPITYTLNKHLIPLANRPMIEYALEKVAEAGIHDVAVNVNPGEAEIQKTLGDGSRFGLHLTYLEQRGGPKGLAHIILNARDWIGDEPFVFYLGDNLVLGSIKPLIERFEREGLDCLLALSKVSDPQRFGVPEIRDGRIVRVIEKPVNPPSPYAVTGIYVYQPAVFGAAAQIAPSPRGELEISDVHSKLIAQGRKVGYEEITGWWKDTGKPGDLLAGNALLLEQRLQNSAEIGEESVSDADCVIRGPVAIGRNCRLRGAIIGPRVSLGDNVTVERTEIANSLIMDDAVIACGGRVTDSIFGRGVVISQTGPDRGGARSFLLGDNAVVEL